MGSRLGIKIKSEDISKNWTVDDSRELYGIRRWGEGFFDVNEEGHVCITPFEDKSASVDLYKIVESAISRGIKLPILFRFTDILKSMVNKIHTCFNNAIKDFGFRGQYILAYPIKVNQQFQVVSDIVSCGHSIGLEAGSKAELMITLAVSKSRDSLILCNGYKDPQFIELALSFSKVYNNLFITIEKLSELKDVIRISKKLGVRPNIGIRIKLSASGSGKWESSGGDKSKFGLFVSELLEAIETLKQNNMLDCFKLMHSHIGSQVTAITKVKEALNEVMRTFIELSKLGIKIKYVDVGGGLGVDYDGSKSNFPSSINYSIQEYANDVVYAVYEHCNKYELEHPTIITESGRASVAHHSVLTFDVFGYSELGNKNVVIENEDKLNESVRELVNISRNISRKNYMECFHDAIQARDKTMTLFKIGYLSLQEKAVVENVFWDICRKLQTIIYSLDYTPDEFVHLRKALADIYFGNFSLFQSMPDHWAIKQLFPIMPIHKLTEKPTKDTIIADITCDSDGIVDQFIDLRDVQETLILHKLNPGERYYVATFLVGAYQETLGDLHNLFGDTNVVHIGINSNGQFWVEKVIDGDTIEELLTFMQYNKRDLIANIRTHLESALNEEKIKLADTAVLTDMFERIIQGGTYVDYASKVEEPVTVAPGNGTNGVAHDINETVSATTITNS